MFRIVEAKIYLDLGLVWSRKQQRNMFLSLEVLLLPFMLWLAVWEAQVLNCVPPRTKYKYFSVLRLKRKVLGFLRD